MKITILAMLGLFATVSHGVTTNLVNIKNDDPVVIQESDPTVPAAIESAIAFASTNLTTRLFNPTNTQEYIDGAGKKYAISNFWEMTLPTQIMDGSSGFVPPTTSNHIFTGYAVYTNNVGMINWAAWRFGRSEAVGFYVHVYNFYAENLTWAATTNQYVLSVSGQPEMGHVYIRPYSTTNLIATLATESGTLITIGSHNSDANAHAALLAGRVTTNRTITVNGVTGQLSTNLEFNVTAGITGATVTNIVSGFNYATQTWTAAGTNATYQLSWDLTNGTFKVLEILP
jgi:hypothetical protein